ncbi:MAG TPA: nuclear transport factor 2 family protein [Solirubrobacteraceae bacterium]|nr:nuclear transport factor 2 family protein [Solirubrobacteraceae bacterium]
MSDESVAVVRRAVQALQESARCGELTASLRELCDPDIHIDGSRRVFNPDVYDGHAGMARLVREMHDAWEEFSHSTERVVDLGDRVLSIQTIAGRGRASGVDVGARSGLIWTVRDGRVTRVEVFGDADEAIRAAGLSSGPS